MISQIRSGFLAGLSPAGKPVWWSLVWLVVLPVAIPADPAAGWSSPENVTRLADYECAPDVAADAKGTLHLVWLGGPRETWRIFHASKPAGGAWSAPAPVGEPVGMNPRADVDPSGALHVCWQAEGDREIWHRRRAPDGAWDAPVRVSASPGVRSLNPDMACDARGRAYIVWHEDMGAGDNWDILLARFDGTAWLPPERISDDPAISSHAAVAAAPDGTLHVVWADAYQEIRYRARSPAGAWSEIENVSRSPKSSRDPAIALGADGAVHAVWHDHSAGQWEIRHAARRGGAWDGPRDVSNAPGTDCYAHVAAAADGAAHVVWHDYRKLYHARVTADGASPPVVVGGGKAKDNAVCIDRRGAVHAVWQDREPGSWDVFHAERRAEGR